MIRVGREELSVEINKDCCQKAKKWALEQIMGRFVHEFNRLFDYMYVLRSVDPNGNFELMVERPTADERSFRGEILSVVGRDSNNQIFPKASIVVEVENIDTWAWFLNNIQTNLELEDGEKVTSISDMQKG
ncbi:hypothetical protein V6N13_108620 [Hibiscus sabdariffa]